MTLKRLIVIGAGAVGGSIGGLLADAELDVVLVARGEHGKQIADNGLVVRTARKTIKVHPTVFEKLDQVAWRQGDLAMLSTKLTDAELVLENLAEVTDSKQPVVCATNGMQGEVWAAARFQTVLSTMVWLPATHLIPGEVIMHSENCPGVLDSGIFKDDSGLGQEILAEFCRWLGLAEFDAVPRDDIKRWKYAKWITNLGGAAQALVTDDWMSVAKAAQAEGEFVLTAAGIARVATQDLLDRCSHIELTSIEGKERQGGSTWQSLQRAKPLESRWLEGAMADLAESLGVEAPVNRKLAKAAQERQRILASDILDR